MKQSITLILLLLFSFIFTADKQPISKPNNPVKPGNVKTVETWDHDEPGIKNEEYKNEIEKLKKEFNDKKQNIINDYNRQIEPLRREREDSINKLRESFAQRRKEVKNKYGIKPKGNKPVKKVKDKRKNNKPPKERVAKPRNSIDNKKPINKKPIPPSDIKENEKDTPPKESKQ